MTLPGLASDGLLERRPAVRLASGASGGPGDEAEPLVPVLPGQVRPTSAVMPPVLS